MVAWDGGGAGPRRLLPAGSDTVMSLRPLPDGALLVAAADPWLGLLAADGTPRWTHGPAQIDPRGQHRNLAVSPDGMLVEFGLKYGGGGPAALRRGGAQLLPPTDDGRVAAAGAGRPRRRRLGKRTAPTLDGKPLPLDAQRDIAQPGDPPDRSRFLLGTEWYPARL